MKLAVSFYILIIFGGFLLGCPPEGFHLWRVIGSNENDHITFNSPCGIVYLDNTYHKTKKLFVVDQYKSQIIVLDPYNSEFLYSFGEYGSLPGQLKSPTNIAVSHLDYPDSVSNDRIVYVADTENHRIQVFTENGSYVREWGVLGDQDGELDLPKSLDVDREGNVYVADYGNHRIQVYDSLGNFQYKWGEYGSDSGQFNGPIDIAIAYKMDSEFEVIDFIAVSDNGNNRVKIFDKNGRCLKIYSNLDDVRGICIDYLWGRTAVLGVGAKNKELFYLSNSGIKSYSIHEVNTPYDVSSYFISDIDQGKIFSYVP